MASEIIAANTFKLEKGDSTKLIFFAVYNKKYIRKKSTSNVPLYNLNLV